MKLSDLLAWVFLALIVAAVLLVLSTDAETEERRQVRVENAGPVTTHIPHYECWVAGDCYPWDAKVKEGHRHARPLMIAGGAGLLLFVAVWRVRHTRRRERR